MITVVVFVCLSLVLFSVLIYNRVENYKLLSELDQIYSEKRSDIEDDIEVELGSGTGGSKTLKDINKYAGYNYRNLKQRRAIGQVRDTGETN